MLGETVTLSQALVVTIFSMLIVFATLLVISFLLDGFKMVFHKKDKKIQQTVVNKSIVKQNVVDKKEKDDEEIIAVIAAAVAVTLLVSLSNIQIKNIRRISQQSPIWAIAGRQEQIYKI